METTAVWGYEIETGKVVASYEELEAELATLKARHSGTKEQLIAVANERDEGRLHIADLERLLRAALKENPTWHSDAAVEAERVLDAAGKGDEPDEPRTIDVPGKGD